MRAPARLWPPARRPQHGLAVVELALLLPVLLLLGLAVAEYGRALYTYNALLTAARSAARQMAIADQLLTERRPPQQEATLDANAKRRACELAYYGHLGVSGGAPLVRGLQPGMVRVCNASLCPDSHRPGSPLDISRVSVRIEGYVFESLLTPLVPNLNFGAIGVTMLGRLNAYVSEEGKVDPGSGSGAAAQSEVIISSSDCGAFVVQEDPA